MLIPPTSLEYQGLNKGGWAVLAAEVFSFVIPLSFNEYLYYVFAELVEFAVGPVLSMWWLLQKLWWNAATKWNRLKFHPLGTANVMAYCMVLRSKL